MSAGRTRGASGGPPPAESYATGTDEQDVRNVCDRAARLIRDGDPILAFDLTQRVFERFEKSAELQRLRAHALARSGAPAKAEKILEQLRLEDNADAETLALLAGIKRDQAEAERARGGRRAIDLYQDAYDLYTAADRQNEQDRYLARRAVMALLSNNGAAAREHAQELLTRLPASAAEPFWRAVMRGEAELILRQEDKARQAYDEALRVDGVRLGDLASARRHARMIFRHFGIPWDAQPVLRMPPVVVFVGHMIDAGTSPTARFPPRLEIPVRAEIAARLRRAGARIGYAPCACGADVLFHEVIREVKGECRIVLPCHPELYVARSVRRGGPGWEQRFNALVEHAPPTVLAEQLFDYRGLSFTYGSMVTEGLAAIRARQLGADLKYMALWDGQPHGKGPGGTADTVTRWRNAGRDVDVIPLDRIRAENNLSPLPPPPPAPERPIPADEFKAKIVGVLFADVAGFSKLTEKQLLLFVKLFLGMVADMIAAQPTKPIKKNTWGDGLFFVFESVRQTGLFALQLTEAVAKNQLTWAAAGLPAELDLRIGVHAGPVFLGIDPVTEAENCIGMHVSRTARIEPITPEGEVYASQEFAAIAEAEGIPEFACNYVGQTEFAKKYGTFPTYHLTRAR